MVKEQETEAVHHNIGLTAKLLFLLLVVAVLCQILIYVPSIAYFRLLWLEDKLNVARISATAADGYSDDMIPVDFQQSVLQATGLKAIVVRGKGKRIIVAMVDYLDHVDHHVSLSPTGPFMAAHDAFEMLFVRSGGLLRVSDTYTDNRQIEIVLLEDSLREAMIIFSNRILLLSLAVSLLLASFVFFALRTLFVGPMQQLTNAMKEFRQNPESPETMLTHHKRSDEIGLAARELSGLQSDLADRLKSRKRLADLGLAVSKINHDLRSILASAQLFSDRLNDVKDPLVQRISPKILRSLNRAVDYTQSVLAYGSAAEAPPKRRSVRLGPIVEDVVDTLGLRENGPIEFICSVSPDFELTADPEQLFRVLMNIMRNSQQAMEADNDESLVKRLSIRALKNETRQNEIVITDTGPGLPQLARKHLFKAFQGSAKPGGTGLGLAIAAELVHAHGGIIELCEENGPGTTFRIVLP